MDHSADKKGQDKALNAQRERVAQLLDSEIFYIITGIVHTGPLMLRPDLDISRDLDAKRHVLSVLHAFNPDYLRLVLEAVLKTKLKPFKPIKPTDELRCMKTLNFIALNRVCVSGNWQVREDKDEIAKHFLTIMCRILYLMEQCLQDHVIPDSKRMFKPNSVFRSINDVYEFLNRRLLSLKTPLPKPMKEIGFEPTYRWSEEDENNQSGRSTLPRRSFLSNNREKSSEELAAKNNERIQKLTAEMAMLEPQLRTVKKERKKLKGQATLASNQNEELQEKCKRAMELAEERRKKLENRKQIIEELQSFGSKEVDLPVDLNGKTEEETNQSDSTLTDSSNEKQD